MNPNSGFENPFVVVVGMCGSGKSSLVAYLKEKSWQGIRFGEVTMRELKACNLPVNEANERTIREEIRKKHGKDAYAKLLLPDIMKALAIGPVVIDGLYSWAEYKYLRKKMASNMSVVAILTTRSIRYERLANRPIRPLTREEAESRDIAEIENLEKGGPIAMADYFLINDGTEEDLFFALDKIPFVKLSKSKA